MDTLVYVEHTVKGPDARLHAALMPRRDLARLQSDCDSLLSLADRLEALSANVHMMNKRSEDAQVLMSRLRSVVSDHLENEAAVMRAVEPVDDPSLTDAIDRVRAEHVAMSKLIVAVIRGLRAIAKDRFPTRLSSFAMSTGMLCEFMRMHAHFKRKEFYPLLSRCLAR